MNNIKYFSRCRFEQHMLLFNFDNFFKNFATTLYWHKQLMKIYIKLRLRSVREISKTGEYVCGLDKRYHFGLPT